MRVYRNSNYPLHKIQDALKLLSAGSVLDLKQANSDLLRRQFSVVMQKDHSWVKWHCMYWAGGCNSIQKANHAALVCLCPILIVWRNQSPFIWAAQLKNFGFKEALQAVCMYIFALARLSHMIRFIAMAWQYLYQALWMIQGNLWVLRVGFKAALQTEL